MPFGHKAVEREFIYMDTEWANSYNETDNSSPEFQPGFLQRPYSETELQEEEASSSRVRERPPIKKKNIYFI